MSYRYIIGIDLGTTNSVVAFIDLQNKSKNTGGGGGQRTIQIFPIPQLTKPGEISQRPMLPSFLYLPGAYELPAGSTALPWDSERGYGVGEFAREQGARVPGRLVASAKSWLCHTGVDRAANILPWGAAGEIGKVSPVEASKRYLQHLREAWNAVVAGEDESQRFERQLLILTVPASFDEVARELTLAAAQQADLPHVILLEEPLAAFYAWLAQHEQDWQNRMQAGQLILVCDVGGGTSDFSIIAVQTGQKGLRFDRLAVGDHLMLGGDNVDITLARHLEGRLTKPGSKLDAQRWQQLVYQCRQAKETLLSSSDPASKADVTIVGSGSSLIGGALKTSLTQADAQRLIVDGFFPAVALHESTPTMRRSGLTELGLPYVQDPAITRHLAAFWRRFEKLLQSETGRAAVYPDFLLFNGGALIPTLLRDRVIEVVEGWFRPVADAKWSPVELANPNPELAVALGAAYYGLVRLGEGVGVGSGSPRAYYLAVGSAQTDQATEPTAAPSAQTAVCLVPRGAEEGFTLQLAEPKMAALTNQPVSFHLFSSSTRLGDRAGDVVQVASEEITPLPPIRTVLRYGRKGIAQKLPVQISVHLSEVGILELWCQSQQSAHRWRLQFEVRQALQTETASQAEEGSDVAAAAPAIDPQIIAQAQEIIAKTFQRGATQKQFPAERVRKNLEELTTLTKEEWPLPFLRTLADALIANSEGRRLSAEHEARWLNLIGFCLRPGFGAPLDDWRIKEVWKLYLQGLHFPRQVQCRSEWWVFWRRIAGGLSAGQQMQLYQQARPAQVRAATTAKKGVKPTDAALSGSQSANQEEIEFWMLVANLEWLPIEVKAELGRLLLQKIRKGAFKPQELWALSRLGARTTLYGPLDRLLPSSEVTTWIEALLKLSLPPTDSAAHALVWLARYTNDRTRDVAPEVRQRVADWLKKRRDAERFEELLTNPAETLEQDEQDWAFGEALPAGLLLS